MDSGFVSCLAPAKINLFLHITGRRADGYHTLQTAFRMLDHGDQLHFRARHDGEIRRLTDVSGVPAEQDLIVRAARLLQLRTECRLGVDIGIDKRLPMGGGLGGGSSDAATTLLALNHLWQLGVPRAQLQEWALELGADVPFFVFGRTALAEGVGEDLQPLDLPPSAYIVVEPPVSVPTVEIFRDKHLTRDSKATIITGFPAAEVLRRIEQEARNDMQPVACRLYPAVQRAVDVLAAHGAARMSGSGACVFLPVEGAGRARQLAEELTVTLGEDWRVWSAHSLDVHPLYNWAG
ncbi:4-(cytidine 5'-diphospho)-2-C-methyl-D-erythritol kinase [Viridibacterium curvum]|uniref:4-diphosphocytidyl-2-C-methyl-D-erythritol kinase n=1 Tax=Viridibacterium curvum TaxID=1101404 RepID=A0ABP9QZR8_9RHOO